MLLNMESRTLSQNDEDQEENTSDTNLTRGLPPANHNLSQLTANHSPYQLAKLTLLPNHTHNQPAILTLPGNRTLHQPTAMAVTPQVSLPT